jgi:hypothetical protein
VVDEAKNRLQIQMLLQQIALHTTAAVTVNVLSLSSSSVQFREKASVSA